MGADETHPVEQTTPSADLVEAFLKRVLPQTDPELTAILDAAAADVIVALRSLHIDALLLKGPGLERLLYGSGERRPYVDIDLLVAPTNHDSAAEVLGGFGYHNATERLGIDDVGHVVHADTWVGVPPGAPHQLVIELHRWLPGAEASAAAVWRSLWANRIEIDLDGRRVAIPSREAQALQLATHAAQHGLEHAKGIRELVMAVERWPIETWVQARDMARASEATGTFSAGLRLVPEGALLAEKLQLPIDSQLEWSIRHQSRRPRGTFHLQALSEAAGVRARVLLLRRALMPGSTWIVAEYPWAASSKVRLLLAYVFHWLRAPLWLTRAWKYQRLAAASRRMDVSERRQKKDPRRSGGLKSQK